MKIVPLAPLLLALLIYGIYQFPSWNIFTGLLDEGFFSYIQTLIGQGLIPYKDFFLVTMPASYYVVAWLAPLLGGEYLLASRILGIAIAIMTLIICDRLFQFTLGWRILYLICLAIFLAVPPRMLTYNDALFTALITLFVIIKSVDRKNVWLVAAAGAMTAVTVLFKQSVGLLLIPAMLGGLFLTIKNRQLLIKFIGSYLAGIIVVLAPTALYFYSVNALQEMIYYTISFAAQVKNHSTSFLINRIAAIPLLIGLFYGLRLLRWRTRLLLISVAIFAGAAYFLLYPNRIGRLLTYLPDPVFYAQSLGFLLPLVILSIMIGRRDQFSRRIIFTALCYLVFFLAIGASGYSIGPIIATVPLAIPLIIYSALQIKRFPKTASWTATGIIVIFTVALSWNPFLPNVRIAAEPLSHYTATLPYKETQGIQFTPGTAKELRGVIEIIKTKTKENEKIFCFPYCPGLYVLTDRQGGSFYSLFYFETFMEKDQEIVMKDLEHNAVKLVVLQKTGELEPRKELEKVRLKKLWSYLEATYPSTVFENRNFIVRMKP